VGGQFAPSAHRRPSVELDVDGQVASGGRGDVSGVREGSRTPWGTADWVSRPAPGAVQVSTPGHGGFKLSAEGNREIPASLRNASGWYEEDCEAGIVAWVHPDACPQPGLSAEQVAESGRQSAKRWFPDAYEAATGETIPLGEPMAKDERPWDPRGNTSRHLDVLRDRGLVGAERHGSRVVCRPRRPEAIKAVDLPGQVLTEEIASQHALRLRRFD
jgi:hypothetical protein